MIDLVSICSVMDQPSFHPTLNKARRKGIAMTTLCELSAGVVVEGENAPFNFMGWAKFTANQLLIV